MKRLLNKITDSLADAAMLEMGVGEKTTDNEPLLAKIKSFFQNFSVTIADAALLEIGFFPDKSARKPETARETLEENLIEVAFAEAADYDDIHKAILREHRSEQDVVHPDECQYGDNDVCFV